MAKSNPVLNELKKASKDIVVVSESDAELEPFLWDDQSEMDDNRVLELCGQEYEEGTPVEETTVKKFFSYSGDQKELNKLAKVLQANLSDLRVYKVGEVEKDVYIVGKTKDGKWAGLKTRVVET